MIALTQTTLLYIGMKDTAYAKSKHPTTMDTVMLQRVIIMQQLLGMLIYRRGLLQYDTGSMILPSVCSEKFFDIEITRGAQQYLNNRLYMCSCFVLFVTCSVYV